MHRAIESAVARPTVPSPGAPGADPSPVAVGHPDGTTAEGPSAARSESSGGAIVLSQLRKLYEPTPRWMRLFARTHIREPVLALDDVNLTVAPGDICALVGPNGAGKTTLFRILVGLTTATSGHGSVLGLDVATECERIRQVVGWMPSEDRSLLMRATARENLHLHGRLQGLRPRELPERIAEVLNAVGLSQQVDSVVAGLSAGMKARLRLARALLSRPQVLILDEPTGAVDPIAAHQLLNLITELVERERLAVLLSSHRLEEIEALKSKALLLDKGRVKYSGNLDDLRELWDTPTLRLVFRTPTVAAVAASELVDAGIEVDIDGTDIMCPLGDRNDVGAVLCRLGDLTQDVLRVHEIPMPLRDLMARVYNNHKRGNEG